MSWKRSSHFMARTDTLLDSLGTVYCILTISRATRRDIVTHVTESSQEAVFLALSAILSKSFLACKEKTLRVALRSKSKNTELEVFLEV